LGLEAIIHQALGYIFRFYTGAGLERTEVDDELVAQVPLLLLYRIL